MGNSSSKSSKRTGHSPTVSQTGSSTKGTASHTTTGQASDESPPSYSVATTQASSKVVAEDALLTIRNYNVVFIIDDSGSMNERGPKGVKLWIEVHICSFA
jgi:hypothetical protein